MREWTHPSFSGQERDFMPSVWYRRHFEVPDTWGRRRIWLHFGAVDYQASVWVNGHLVGTHRGGYTPFSFDITNLLRAGENELVVNAVDDTRSPAQPTGKQSPRFRSYRSLYTRTTGIWQTVWLEALSKTHIYSLRMILNLDAGRLTLTVAVSCPFAGLKLRAVAQVEGRTVAQVEGSAFAQSVSLVLEPEEIKPWSPSDPFLGEKIFFNNRLLFQRLVLDQGFYPDGIYTAPSDEALRSDIKNAQVMGFNGARLHQKVFEPRFLYWADKLGYLVWAEYPNWGIDHKQPESLEYMLLEWLEEVNRDFNHPSIVGWCPFNETPRDQDPELIRTIYRVTKSIDPT